MYKRRIHSKASVRLGVMPPLTGLVALYGSEITRAAKIACDEVNENGGVLGRPLELIIEDDGSMPELAVPAAERLIVEYGCVALIGNLLSNSRIVVADHVSLPRRVPYLNFSFYEGSIFNRYFFNFSALPNQQIDKMIPYMVSHFGPKMFFAGNNYEWPRGSIDAAKRCLLAHHGEVVGEEYFPIGSKDYAELMQKIALSGADVFVPYAAGADQINLLNQFTAAGLKQRMAVVMGHYDEAMVSNLAPDVREGLYSSNTYFLNIQSKANQEYLQRLARVDGVSGIWPLGNGVTTNFGEGAYVCVHALAKAGNMAGSLEAEKLVEALEMVKVSAPQGEVIMDPVTHHASVNSYLAKCESNGSFTIVEKFGLINPQIPERYQHSQRHSFTQNQQAETNTCDDWKILSIVSFPLPGARSALSPMDSKLFNIGVDPKCSDALFIKLKECSDDILRLNCSGSDYELEVKPGVDQNTKERLLLTPIGYGGKTQYLLVRGREGSSFRGFQGSQKTAAVNAISAVNASLGGNEGTLDHILGATDVGIVAVDEAGKIIKVNRKLCELFGFAIAEIQGKSVHLLLPPHLRSKHEKHVRNFVGESVLQPRMAGNSEISCYRKDGSFFPAETSLSKFKTDAGWISVATLADISQRKKFEEDLVWQATHDMLTQLPNRVLIKDRLENALMRSIRGRNTVALMFIDVDEFKLVNDSYGHDTGDRLLKIIADELATLIRPGDTVGRFGGDEFVVICEQINDAHAVTVIAERIVDTMRRPISIDDIEVFVSVSIGIAIGYGAVDSADEMLGNADAAMYNAKARGRDGWIVFSDSMAENSKRFLKIANGLRGAIKNSEFYTVIQPILSVKTGKIVSGEILLRWRSQDADISPAEFIPVAEMTGSILEIGRWVFDQACGVLGALRKMLPDQMLPHISVNVSARQLSDDSVVDFLLNTVQKHRISPTNLSVEVTETALISDIEKTVSALNSIGRAGFLVAVDDFGTGYSSLSMLKKLPVDTLKVDKIFVDDIAQSEDAYSIASAIVSMAHSLGLSVTAEGVETKQQLEVLTVLGCDNVQGYYFYRPLPVEEFVLLCLSQSPDAKMVS